ncbi:hypothetical protein Tco_0669660 [Tanacetum coccineum]
MEISIADQIALDDALVAPTDRLKIGKCNLRLSSDVTSKDATLQVVYDVFKMNKKCHFNLDQFRDILQIFPKVGNQKFEEPPLEKEILAFLASLGHSREVRKIIDVNVNKLHQPWRSFAKKGLSSTNVLSGKIPPSEGSKTKVIQYYTKDEAPQSLKKERKKVWKRGSRSQNDEDEDKNDDNETTKDDEDDNVHDDDENAQIDDDEAHTESEDDGDDFIHPKLTTHDDEIIHEEETNEDDTFDPIVHTPLVEIQIKIFVDPIEKTRTLIHHYSDPRGFIYENKDKKNRLMRIDELHKFSDGTLDDVRTALNDRLKGIRMEYLP